MGANTGGGEKPAIGGTPGVSKAHPCHGFGKPGGGGGGGE